MSKYFKYSEKETDYLSNKDKKMKEIISLLPHIDRELDDCDLFQSLMHHIIGQQISTSAQKTIYARLIDKLKVITPESVYYIDNDELQSIGITYKKVTYMKGIAKKVIDKELNLDSLYSLSDQEVIKQLSSLDGIGVWTAEMILLFNMERENIFSYGDLAIQRGLRMVYHHKKITRELFEKYRRRFSPSLLVQVMTYLEHHIHRY